MGIDANTWSFLSLLGEPLPRDTTIDYNTWEKMTFSEQDIFAQPVSVIDNGFNIDFSYNNGSIPVTEVSTMFNGKCYSISTQKEVRANMGLLILLRYPWSKKSHLVSVELLLENQDYIC
jgi:hypothetical protein